MLWIFCNSALGVVVGVAFGTLYINSAISGKKGKSQRDPFSIGEQPHLDDRVGTVFLTFSVLFVPISLLNLKIIVRAVIIKDAIHPFGHKIAVFINLSLDQVTFLSQDIQGPVDIMFFVGRRLQKIHSRPVGSAFAAGFQDSCINKIRQDRVDIIMEAVFILDFSADPVKAQLVINSLRKEVSPFKKFLLMIIQGSVRMKGESKRSWPGFVFYTLTGCTNISSYQCIVFLNSIVFGGFCAVICCYVD